MLAPVPKVANPWHTLKMLIFFVVNNSSFITVHLHVHEICPLYLLILIISPLAEVSTAKCLAQGHFNTPLLRDWAADISLHDYLRWT